MGLGGNWRRRLPPKNIRSQKLKGGSVQPWLDRTLGHTHLVGLTPYSQNGYMFHRQPWFDGSRFLPRVPEEARGRGAPLSSRRSGDPSRREEMMGGPSDARPAGGGAWPGALLPVCPPGDPGPETGTYRPEEGGDRSDEEGDFLE